MDHPGHLYDKISSVGKGRSGNRLSEGGLSSDTPRSARRQKEWPIPAVEEAPERASKRIMTTRSTLGLPRFTKRDSIGVDSSPTVAKALSSPLSPHSTFFKASQPRDTPSKSRKSSYPEKLIYLPGSTTAYIDMTSLPTKETPRAQVWIVQQLGHFFEHKDPVLFDYTVSEAEKEAAAETAEIAAFVAKTRIVRDPSLAAPIPVPTGFPPTWYDRPGPVQEEIEEEIDESIRIGPRQSRPGRPVRYANDDDGIDPSLIDPRLLDPSLDQQEADEELGAESNVEETSEMDVDTASDGGLETAPQNLRRRAQKANYDERPKTLSEKEIYRRNYAVEHEIYPQFLFKDEAMKSIFRADDKTLSKKAFDLGTVLVKILQSTLLPSDLEEEQLLLTEFTSAIKKTYNDHGALLDAFQRLARIPYVQKAVLFYLRRIGKPEVDEFGEDNMKEEVVHRRQKYEFRSRAKQNTVPLMKPVAAKVADAWKSLSAFKPYSTPYPNLTPVAEPTTAAGPVLTTAPSTVAESSKGKGKEVDTSAPAQAATSLTAPPQRAPNLLSESQIDNLLALASGGSESEDDDDDDDDEAGDVPNTLENVFRDVQMASLLRRYVKQAAKKEDLRFLPPDDWTLLPFVTTLVDPHRTKTPDERFVALRQRPEDFVTRFVKPTVNTVLPADQAQALSELYAFMGSRVKPSPLRSIYENEGPHVGRFGKKGMRKKASGAAGPSAVGGWIRVAEEGSGRLTPGQLAAIKEDVQKEYDAKRARRERVEPEEVKEPKVATKDRPWRW